jgi:predicted enzyme related to lactoylglutathione lyase
MVLKQSRLVTEDVERLTYFYKMLTGATPEVFSTGYVEFQHNPCAGLAIVGTAVARVYGEGVVAAAENRSLVLDFEVDDVDAEYARLKTNIEAWVQPPTNLPWGNRAMLFRDPDGNLINMFTDPRRAGSK